MKRNIIIATGGTGGHIFPAMSVANTFIDNDYNVLITTNEKSEKFFVNSKLNYKIINSGSSILKLKSICNIIKGTLQSIILFFKFKPEAVIGFGSYATLPILIVSKLFKVPIFLHEGNAFVGKINKIFFASSVNVFTSFQEIYGVNIKYSDKICFSGAIPKSEIMKYYDNVYKYPQNGKFNILITGGSGGASFFSTELIKIFDFISDDLRNKLEIVHQVKSNEEVEIVKDYYSKKNIKSEVKTFFEDISDRMLKSDLIICRSGIGTISEISVVGRPCIMIPSPNVANDHQLYNARFYNKNNSCILFEEKNFIIKSFSIEFEELLNNKDKMEELASNIKSMAVIDSNFKIFEIVNDYLLKKI